MTYHDITCLYLIELGKRGIDPDPWRDRISEFAEVSMGTEPEIRRAIDLDIVKAQFPGQCVGVGLVEGQNRFKIEDADLGEPIKFTKVEAEHISGNAFRVISIPGETDPNKLTPKEPGCKLDAGKQIAGELVFSFPRAMQALIEVATFGAKKYSRSGFLSVPDAHKRYMDALMRHLLAYGSGEEMDPESGMPHMWHALWNAAALVELKRREEEIKP